MIHVDVVAFDLDNTLYDEFDYFSKIIDASNLMISLDQKEFKKIRKNSKDVLKSILKNNKMLSVKNKDIFFESYKNFNGGININSDKIKTIKNISKHFKTCILTNGIIEVQKNKVRSLSIEDIFDKIIYARSHGRENEKPDKKAFKMICDYFKCKPNRVLFVGDHPMKDIKGAKEFGMKTVWTTEFIKYKSVPHDMDYHIKNLSEIDKLLGMD